MVHPVHTIASEMKLRWWDEEFTHSKYISWLRPPYKMGRDLKIFSGFTSKLLGSNTLDHCLPVHLSIKPSTNFHLNRVGGQHFDQDKKCGPYHGL